MLGALILALAIPALAAPAEPQIAVPAPPDAAPRAPTQEVKSSGIVRGRITSLDTGKPLRRALGGDGSNDLALHVDTFNGGLDKACPSESGTDWLRPVPQF
jgi:hypothetical protein